MGCGTFGVNQILIGLHRIGLIGFPEALETVAGSGFADRETVVDALVAELETDNYLPQSRSEAFRTAMWREYLRHCGEDFSDFYSEAEVTVIAEPGEERDRFVALVTSVFADFELKPVITFAAPENGGRTPALVAGDEVVARGVQTRENLKRAVRRSFSDW